MITNEPKTGQRTMRGRRWLRALAFAIGIFALLMVALIVFTRTDSFHRWVHAKVVADLEDVTGGKVELGQVSWSLSRLHFVGKGLVIHGTEAPGLEPYVRAESVTVDAKVLSWMGRQVGLRAITIEKPAIHIIVYPDGRTNQPTPKPGQQNSGSSVQRLFDVKLDRLEVRNGLLLVNDYPMPFDFAADDVQTAMSFVAAAQRFDGHATIGKMQAASKNLKPFLVGAAAEFSLFPNQLQVKGLKISSGTSTVEASGDVIDFADPHANLSYKAVIDLAETGQIMLLPQLRRGTMTVSGTGQYTTKNYGTTGKVAAQKVEYRDPSLALAEFDGGAEFSADKDNFVLPHFFARVLGGVVTGSAEVKNWSNAPSAPGQATPASLDEQVGTIHAKVQSVPVARLAAAASTRTLPLDRLHAVGTANGTIEASWRGAPSHMRAQFAVEFTPPAVANAEELPVSGKARGAYVTATQALDLAELDLTARSVQVKAVGMLAYGSHLSFTTTAGDLRDVSPLLTAWSDQRLPAELSGSGTLSGILSGRLATAPNLSGHVTLSNVQVPLPFKLPAPAATVMKPVATLAPPQATSAPRLVRFDSVTADIQYSPSELVINNGVAKRGTEQATLSATIGLVKGHFLETNPIEAKATAKNFDIGDLLSLGGYNVRISGVVNGELDIHGTQDDPRGSAQIQLTTGTFYGQPFQSARAYVTFLQQEAEFSNVEIAQNSARVTGNANYNLKTTTFRFDLAGKNFNLAEFRQFQGAKVSTAGLLSFEARGSGSKDAPIVDADLHLRNLTMNGERLGNLEGTAKTTAGVMHIRARSDFRIADFDVDGTVGMHGDFPADLVVKMARLDVDPFLQIFVKANLTGHSAASGTIRIAGLLRDPKSLTLDGDLDQFSADIENVKIHNDGPLRFTVKDRLLRLEQFKLAGTDTTLTAEGSIALAGNLPMDVRALGRVNLTLLQSFNPDLHTGGSMDFDMRAGGTLARPTLFGTVKINNGTFTNINFPNGLSALNGTLVFNQDRFQIQQLTGITGGGNVTFGGFVTYGNAITFNLTANAKDVRLRYPQGMSETLDGDVRLTGTRDSSTLTGDVVVTRFSVNQNFDLALAIAASKSPPTPPDPTSWLNNLRLNLKVTSAPDLQVTTSLAKLSGDLNMNLRGTATRPARLGRINITEGQVSFNGTTYQLDRGDISFSNPVKIEPVVDVAATTRVRDYDVTLGFHGPVDRLSTTYRSDPPLPTADIISLLAFGKTREESEMASAAQPTFSESASNAILGQALNAAVTSRVQRLFGVSRVKIAPEIGGAETDPNAKVTIEQQVSKDFTVTYITDLSHSSQQSIQVEYNYSRNLSVIGSRDQYGIVSFDVRIRSRRK
jgi:translocation and assembly module TamB